MKKILLVLLLLSILVPTVRGQEEASELEWLTIDFWPDYDRPSVLVLLTGAVAASIPLPAEVTIPLPQDATINAVARITEANELIDDIEYTAGDESITLTTPARRFRVEYYFPYTARDLEREFSYTWLADLSVDDLQIAVQQPAVATTLQTDPEAVGVETEGELEYHYLAPVDVGSGDPYRVTVSYSMNSEALSASGEPATTSAEPAADAVLSLGSPVILVLIGVLFLLLAVGWYFFGDRLRPAGAPRKPRPVRAPAARNAAPRRADQARPETLKAARFCHECGERAQEGDRYCRACGTKLKGPA